jgi:glycosyltransferase involved in cell wall biosynthesis
MGDPEFSKRALQVIINVERRLAKVTKKLITVGEQVSKDLLQVGVGKPHQYISIASEGQSLNFISREAARAKLNIQLDTPVVLWMARMAPVKNPSLALEVARLLPEINFLMAGGGELFEHIKAQAPPNALLLKWIDPGDVIPAAVIFLSTSLNEGIPYSLLEVLSAGVSVVAVQSGSIGEIIEHETNGILTSQDPNDIAVYISDLISNPSRRVEIAQSAHNLSVRRVKLKKMVPKHVNLYKEFLGSEGPYAPRH